MMLMALGGGISSANAAGRPLWEGIGPAGMMYGNSLGQAQRYAYERAQDDEVREMRRQQFDLQKQEFAAKQREREIREKGLGMYLGTLPGGTPGMCAPPPTPTMGPGDYFDKTAKAESGGSYTIPNALGSGAYGKYQFMPSTWADVARKHPELGLPFDMRKATPEQQEAAMRAFTADNADQLRRGGVVPTADNLYLAHRFGVGGANTMLRADPNAPVASLYPASWAAQNPDMRGVTAGQFRANATKKFGADVPAGLQGGAGVQVAQAPSAPPTLSTVPRPMVLPPEMEQRLRALAATQMWTPPQIETMRNSMLDALHKQQQEAATARFNQESETYRFNRQQTAEDKRFNRNLETEGEYVRGPDGVERFVPKSQRQPGQARYDKPPAPGTDSGDVHILNTGDPASPEYAGAYNRVQSKVVDGPNGLKLQPNMSAYRPPAGPQPAQPTMGGMQPIGDRTYTESQNRDFTYATRLATAIPQLEAMVVNKDGTYSTKNLPSNFQQLKANSPYVPESMIPEQAKEFRRVVKDIMTATLRRESGATIRDEEFVSEAQKFIPQPGDSSEVIKNKLAALRQAARSIAEGSGRPLTHQDLQSLNSETIKAAPIRIDLGGKRQ